MRISDSSASFWLLDQKPLGAVTGADAIELDHAVVLDGPGPAVVETGAEPSGGDRPEARGNASLAWPDDEESARHVEHQNDEPGRHPDPARSEPDSGHGRQAVPDADPLVRDRGAKQSEREER